MSYFDTLNQFVDNANQAQEHLDEYKNSLVSSKVADIKDKYDQYLNSIENYGQATLGVASAYHMGRKIYKKVKEKYGKDPVKDKKKEEEDKPEADEPEEPLEEGEQQFRNPAFEPTEESIDTLQPKAVTSSENPAGVPSQEEQESGVNDRSAEGESAETETPAEATQLPEGAGGRSLGEDIRGGIPKAEPEADISSLGQSQTPLTEEQARAFTQDAASEATDGVNEISDISTDAVEKAGKSIASKFVENTGAKIAEKVGFDAVGAVADAVPIVGELAGLWQIFHGLHKEFKERKQEGKEEQSAAESIRAAGSVAVGGVDIGAVASQGAAIGGLV